MHKNLEPQGDFLKNIFKIYDLLSWVYPLNKWKIERIIQYYYSYHILDIIKTSNRYYMISEYFDLMWAFNQAPFRGMVKDILRVNNYYLSPKDLAIAINISIHGYCNEKSTDNDSIIDFSYHLTTELKNRLITDKILKNYFSDINKDIDLLVTEYDRDEILNIFTKKKDIFINYFNTFEDTRFNQSIRIWHQAEGKSWIEWKKEDSLEIKLNKNKIREGFFLMGFDYSSDDDSDLYIATRKNGFEYYNDSESRDRAVWIR